MNSISTNRVFISSRFCNAIWFNMQVNITESFLLWQQTCNWRRTHWLLWGPDILIISWHLCLNEESLQRIEAIFEQSWDRQFDKFHLLSKLAVKETAIEQKDAISTIVFTLIIFSSTHFKQKMQIYRTLILPWFQNKTSCSITKLFKRPNIKLLCIRHARQQKNYLVFHDTGFCQGFLYIF